MELHLKYRPKKLSELVGQPAAVKTLSGFVKSGKIPHSLMLTGPSGVGKTTAARILRNVLKCSEHDFTELNAADSRGIDTIRDIRGVAKLRPMNGECRIWLIDESHKLTSDAQNAFLKLLEEPPDHAYFMLVTTDPEKIIRTVRTRCTEIKFNPLGRSELIGMITAVAAQERTKLERDAADKIAEIADGSARKALVLLEQILHLPADERMDALEKADLKVQAIQLARVLMNPTVKWPEIAKILSGLESEEPESLRYMVLGYFRSVMLKNHKMAGLAASVLACFADNWYDSKHAGLALACWDAVQARKRW